MGRSILRSRRPPPRAALPAKQKNLLFQKVAIFVDAENIEMSSLKHHEGRTDYKKILERVGNGTSVRFSELFGQIVSRVEIVVTFLALLELIRLNQVRALQPKMFDEIEIAAIAA